MSKPLLLIGLVLLLAVAHCEVLHLTDANFQQTLGADPLQVWMVFFHADWCQLCKELMPQFVKADDLMHSLDIKFATFNEKGNPNTVAQYVADPKTFLLEYPAIIVFAGNEALARVPGQLRNSYSFQHWFLNYFKVIEEKTS